jgi:hypothetical protein
MTATTVTPTELSARHHGAGRLVVRRAAWLVFAVALVAFAAAEVGKLHLGPWPIVVFLIFPDLSFLAAIGVPTEQGRLATRAVPIYNFVHRPIVPLAIISVATLGLVPRFWLVAGVSWLAHIAIDRTVGYGLRGVDGWQR